MWRTIYHSGPRLLGVWAFVVSKGVRFVIDDDLMMLAGSRQAAINSAVSKCQAPQEARILWNRDLEGYHFGWTGP